MARKKKPEEHVNHERWLVSYADFITLLFATFTALFAISSADMEKWEMLAKSLANSFANNEQPKSSSMALLEGGSSPGADITVVVIDDTSSGSGKGKYDEPAANPADVELEEVFDPVAAVLENGEEEAEELFGSQEAGEGQHAGGTTGTESPGATPTPEPTPASTPAAGNAGEGAEAATASGASQAGDSGESMGETGSAVPTPTPTPEPTPQADGGDAMGTPEGRASAAMATEIRQLLADVGLEGQVQVRQETRGMVVSLGEAAFFAPGGIDVLPHSSDSLAKIVNAMRGKNFEIRVEGHTDDTPVGPGRPYRTNSELSSMRASRVMDFMIREYGFDGHMLSSAGFGEFRPIADNATLEGRQKNRRVDIVILNQHEAAKDPH